MTIDILLDFIAPGSNVNLNVGHLEDYPSNLHLFSIVNSEFFGTWISGNQPFHFTFECYTKPCRAGGHRTERARNSLKCNSTNRLRKALDSGLRPP